MGLGAAVLLLVAYVSTADWVKPLRGSNAAPEDLDSDPSNVPAPPNQGSGVQTQAAKPVKVPLWLDIFFNIMLIAFALILDLYVLPPDPDRARGPAPVGRGQRGGRRP